ncbi:amidohydrolase family protein [bacterium]|nr:amidohydrolase family protein [bacterium]
MKGRIGSMIQRVFQVGYLADGGGEFRSDCEIYIKDGLIGAILDAADHTTASQIVRREFAGAERIELADGFLLPGLINSHHHAYSALARGITVKEALPDFPAILERLWWQLDEILDAETVRLSALVTALESVRHGCTTIFDHHSSPRAISGSLDVIAEAFETFHLSAVLCYETSDRNGANALDQAIEENLRFCEVAKKSERMRGMFGLHASFTLGDESLKRIAREKPATIPIHVHVAEDQADVRDAKSRGYGGPLLRLKEFGLLDEHSLIVHGVHLSESELALAERIGLRIAHNTESNCNNRVGYSDPGRFRHSRVLLGTDGMSSNLLASLRSAFLLYAGLGGGNTDRTELAEAMLFHNPTRYASDLFGREMGLVRVGDPADFAIFPYAAPTPITAENWTSHVLYGLSGNVPASYVYANGRAIIENGVCTVIDEFALMAEARDAAARLWKKFESHTRAAR